MISIWVPSFSFFPVLPLPALRSSCLKLVRQPPPAGALHFGFVWQRRPLSSYKLPLFSHRNRKTSNSNSPTFTSSSPPNHHQLLRSVSHKPVKMVKNFSLLCLENPLLDIQATGTQELLDKYNLKANDAILADPNTNHLELYDELVNNYSAKFVAGGAAQNTARGAQYILPADSVLYIGCIGKDEYGKRLQEVCAAEGLRVEYRIDEEVPTGRCGVIITGHNRSMCTDLGAANHYKLDHLKSEKIWKLVEEAEYYYVGGYHLTVSVPAILALAEEAAAKDKPFVMNISAPFIAQFFKDQLASTSKYWDYLIGNETEAEAYADANGLGTKDVKEIAKHLANLPKENTKRKRVVIITQGTHPTIVATQGEDAVHEFEVHAVEEKDIVDTNGAGDAFAGGFLAGLVSGKDLRESIDMAQWLASWNVRQLGPSFPQPKQTYTRTY
ncbi:adenosine kinase [Orbilia oligospora]|uniref:adenosine kinase n=1 Tax=Orbilia oligospora TaxID=2813651 RepID=A0A6G1MK28_ORBOL|nr:adenosine kinase [Orbilia oligospora]KAF3219819.1 adenosine kinase [Orbilia oligospora]KAF3226924.1 adenosine kinase [Orbilia oligospora]KAF3261575.1 adenosine kinase [Orbilia oligospora]